MRGPLQPKKLHKRNLYYNIKLDSQHQSTTPPDLDRERLHQFWAGSEQQELQRSIRHE
ncbi:hypothetical protein EYZ11_006784 [Aspergillus tanneri]|uniref:Uncharacterized protein n=1 Tax=Aspergillus tanneri TaxID=1220188 RepID=A0A4V6RQT2_9EURO|nr:hypothetical protein EYZ11_006784 [Aspergillus tanneri]